MGNASGSDYARHRATALALARQTCARCRGTGSTERGRICGCVHRAVFRQSMERYDDPRADQAIFTLSREDSGSLRLSMLLNEFRADLINAARRVLTPAEFQVFTLHALEGRDYKACVFRLQLPGGKGQFFNMLYRLEERLGRELLAIRMYPTWAYLGARALATSQLGRCSPKPRAA